MTTCTYVQVGMFFSSPFPDDNNLIEFASEQAAHQDAGQPSSFGDGRRGTSGTTYINASFIQVCSLYFVLITFSLFDMKSFIRFDQYTVYT